MLLPSKELCMVLKTLPEYPTGTHYYFICGALIVKSPSLAPGLPHPVGYIRFSADAAGVLNIMLKKKYKL